MIAKNKLTQSDLEITQLGLGCASLAGLITAVDQNDARATIDGALKAGINYVDTAPFYGYGLSERLVGDGVRFKSDLVISSKVGRLLEPGSSADTGQWAGALPFTSVYDYSYDAIMRSFEDSLQRTGLDQLDILYMHDIGNYTHGDELGPKLFKIAMDEGYPALAELKSSGAVSAIGMGVNEREVCQAAMQHGDWDVFLLAGRYTLLEQAPLDDLFPACEKAGTDIVIGGPFNSGVLVGGETFDYDKIPQHVALKVAKLKNICAAHNVPLPAAALQFPGAHSIVKSVIPGPRTPVELAQILDWWKVDIPSSLWSDLKSEDAIMADAPLPG